MSDSILRQLLETAIKDVCDTNVPKVPCVFQNTVYNPKVGYPYVQCFILPAKTLDPSIGDRHSRKLGIFQISCFFNVGEGSSKIESFKDRVENYFYRGRAFTKNSEWVYIDSTPSSTSAFVQNGWYVLHISVDYRMEVFR